MKNNQVTITIPCYNQPDLLRGCFASLAEQTYKDFTVLIIDDHSTADYGSVIKDFSEKLSITYVRNEKNLGAIKNIFNSITYPVSTPYVLSLHEDDCLRRDYLRLAVDILNKNEDVMFVGSPMNWFETDQELLQKRALESPVLDDQFKMLNAHDLVVEIIKGIHLGFGSIVYRSEVTRSETPDFKQFDVVCDRPYLTKIIGEKKCAVIKDAGIYVRRLPMEMDHRGDTLTVEHIANLGLFYQNYMQSKEEVVIWRKYITNNILYGYHRLRKLKPGFIEYLRYMKGKGLIHFSSIRPLGILGLLKGFMPQK